MYHIKEDKRSLTTSKMLYDALIEQLNCKRIDEISITELVTFAGVGRSTFYRNFDNIVDILNWRCDLNFAKVIEDYYVVGSKSNITMTEYIFDYWYNNSEVIEKLLAINRIDIIYDSFIKNSKTFAAKINVTSIKNAIAEEYFLTIRIGIFISVMKVWIENGKKESPKQLSALLTKQIAYSAKNNLI